MSLSGYVIVRAGSRSGIEALIHILDVLVPIDDCLYALQATLPHLTRSSLHRSLQRHGISRLPDVEETHKRKRFAADVVFIF